MKHILKKIKHDHKHRLHLAADLALILALIIFFTAGLLIGLNFAPNNVKEFILPKEKVVTVSVPAINQNSQGVMTKLTTKLKQGDGQVLVNVNDVIAGYELQLSARNVVHAVESFTNTSLNNYDVTFSIKTDASLVDGSSASAAMGASVMALLLNKKLNPKATITGSVDDSGNLKPIGGLFEKITAAKNSNLSLIIIPKGQSSNIEQVKTLACNTINGLDICDIKFEPNLNTKGLGITISEAATLKDAFDLFTNFNVKEDSTVTSMKETENKFDLPSVNLLMSTGIDPSYAIIELTSFNNMVKLKAGCAELDIPISEEESMNIVYGINKKIIERPMIHDLITSLIDLINTKLIAVTVDEYESGIYKSKIIFKKDNKVIRIDSKPSDALALAVRNNKPIFVKKSLLNSRGKVIC